MANASQDRDRETERDDTAARPFVVRPRAVSRQRNRIVGLALAGFVFLVLLTIFSLVILVHHGNATHALARL